MDADDNGPDQTLNPSESLDSDEVRNDDGDIVVDPPERWIPVVEDQSLDERLAAEVPDVLTGDPQPPARPAAISARSTARRKTATRSTRSSTTTSPSSPDRGQTLAQTLRMTFRQSASRAATAA